MKLHVLSDLHIEYADFVPQPIAADVVILAGDIGVGVGGVEWAGETFPDRTVIYVPGNHEYYGHDIGFTAALKAAAADSVHVLNDDVLELDGVRFLGSTLWTDFRLYGEAEASVSRRRAGRGIEDFHSIGNGERRFTPEDSVEIHEKSTAWLAEELAREFDGPTVVITHHLPAQPSIAERYVDDPLNPAFASRLEDLIEKHRPDLWIHGHTHVPCDYDIFGTRVVCNPRGYPREANAAGFRSDLVVEI